MTRAALLKKIEIEIDAAINGRMYGEIQIEFKAGYPMFLRRIVAEKLDDRENPVYGNGR